MDLPSLETLAVMDAENKYIEVQSEGEEESHEQTLSVTRPFKPVRKRRRAKCWVDFTHLGLEDDGKVRARCNHCGFKFVVEKNHGTSILNRHSTRCPAKPRPDAPKYDHKADREKMSEIIIYHDLLFKYIEYEKVRERDRFLNPDVQHICRQTAAADVYKRYEIEKAKLIEVFVKHKGRVCFTADLWTARSVVMGYICITAHFIDENWRLNNKILAFCNLKPPYSGEEIAKAVYDCLKGWGLEKKVFTITLDNAKANDSMLNILKHRLLSSNGSSNGLLCNGKFLNVRCSAHILNLIVKAGLELATSLIENIRESVKFVKASESRKDSFAICVESAGITSGAGLSLDVSTRWNSTYEMLARALKFREAFAILNLYERGYKWLPSEEEWERGVKICDLLKPFNTISTYFSGVKYPTANVYFIQVWKIEMMLKKYADCKDDGDVRTMARAMQKKFAKYWNQYSVILAMGAALDPRLKLDILRSAYQKIDPRTSEEKVQVVRDNLISLYEEYQKSANPSKFSATLTPHELLTESPLEDDMDDVSSSNFSY
ncbi:zinc finger BED domain-containing protein RICESLEEPER 2-like [Brassica napus]|uniref:zinc finger BED domain-containing protein RICESLEEPER 2-like n=1 Tax=Brassica napus TaxID=3708 RepID=UPI002078675A|nr:zinc finger BED domain-containing protein RICESLEEPER 2-like [Brassica napus]